MGELHGLECCDETVMRIMASATVLSEMTGSHKFRTWGKRKGHNRLAREAERVKKKISTFETWSKRIFNFRSLQTSRQGFCFFKNVKDYLKEIYLKVLNTPKIRTSNEELHFFCSDSDP